MKRLIFLLLILPEFVFSQNSICKETKIISSALLKEDYNKALKHLRSLDSTRIDRDLIDYFSALCLKNSGRVEEAYRIFERLSHSEKKRLLKPACKTPPDEDEENINLLLTFTRTDITDYSWQNMILINEEREKIDLAIRQFNEYYFNRRNRIFLDANAFKSQLYGYAYWRMQLLKNKGDYKEINKHSLETLLFIDNKEHWKDVLDNLLREYSMEDIKNELQKGLQNIRFGEVEFMGGRISKSYFIPFFDNKIIIWNDKIDKEKLREYVINHLAWQYMMKQ